MTTSNPRKKGKKANRKTPGVWCVLCKTNLLQERKVVIRHIREKHPKELTDDLIERILANTSGKVFEKPKPTRISAREGSIREEKAREDAMKARMPGSYGTGKRR